MPYFANQVAMKNPPNLINIRQSPRHGHENNTKTPKVRRQQFLCGIKYVKHEIVTTFFSRLPSGPISISLSAKGGKRIFKIIVLSAYTGIVEAGEAGR